MIEKNNNELGLFKGISHLELRQFHLAEEALSSVRINSDIFFEEATWYLALACLKRKKNLEAIDYLDELIELKSVYYLKSAEELKSKLQN